MTRLLPLFVSCLSLAGCVVAGTMMRDVFGVLWPWIFAVVAYSMIHFSLGYLAGRRSE